MKQKEYMKLPFDIMPQEIIDQYNLTPLVHTNGYIYIKISNGMYGFPQAGRISNDQLQKHLEKYGYHHLTKITGLWTHKTRNTSFVLVVKKFGIGILLTIISNT